MLVYQRVTSISEVCFIQRQDMAEYLLDSCQIEYPWNFEILTNVDNYATKAGHLTAKLAIGVCLKMVSTPKPNGFADHYPYFKWLFHWEYTLFSDKPIG